MQEDYYGAYREHLRKGMRVEVGIPLLGGGIFRDWAVIAESEADELQAQISRDVLPANVRVDVGFILDVSVWIKKEVYTCSGIVTERLGGRVLRIRLFGAFTLRERRQFFRIELSLRIKYALLSSPNKRDVELDWEQRRDLEHMKFQGYDQVVIAAQQARYRPCIPVEWHDVLWSEVNLGGGGLLIRLPEPVAPERLLCLEIHLPLAPPRQIQAVVEVIHQLEPKVSKNGTPCYGAGVRFVFLDERDRDLIFRHISVTQIALLRQVADRREQAAPAQPGAPTPWTLQRVLPRVLWALFFIILCFFLVRYLVRYHEAGSPNEIGTTYEKAIRQYRHQDK
jgi:hypothetical protein